MEVKFWGTRGSVPVPGKDTIKYGGNTPCVEIRTSSGNEIILDAGTGIRSLGNYIVENKSGKSLDILLSHYHWDHIQGIPFFVPLYQPGRNITFYGLPGIEKSIKKVISSQMQGDYFPIKIDDVAANLNFEQLKPSESFKLDGVNVDTYNVYHPSPTLTFRLSENNGSVVYMTDNELDVEGENRFNLMKKIEEKNKNLIEFCYGCDYLIHDMMFDENLMKQKYGWGHSSNKSLASFAVMAKVKNLIFFHYNPEYNDEKIDSILKETREFLKERGSDINCIAAKEGLTFSV